MVSLNYVALYSHDFDQLTQLEHPNSAISLYFSLAFNRNIETNFVHPKRFDTLANEISIARRSLYYGYLSLVDAGLFVPTPGRLGIAGQLQINLKGGDSDVTDRKYIRFSKADFSKLMNLDHFSSAMRVFRILAFRRCNLETGEVNGVQIKRVAEKAAISYSSAYNGYHALVKAKLFEPDPDGRPICGKILLSCFAKPKQPETRSSEITEERRNQFQSMSAILDSLRDGKGMNV